MAPGTPAWWRYGFAAAVVLAASVLHWTLQPLWAGHMLFVSFYPAVMLAAWLGGLGPGLVATGLSALAVTYLWLELPAAFATGVPGHAIALGLFVAAGVAASVVVAARDRARQSVDLLLRHTPLGLAIHDAEFRYVRVNRALAEINGLPAEAHPGRTVRQVLGDAAAAALEPLLRRVHATRQPVTVDDLRVPLADGSERYFSLIYSPILDGRGRVTGTTASVVEVTARVRAEGALRHERELLQTIIDTIPAMITMYEPDTRVLRLNREFERVTGWSTAEARAMDFMAACYPDPAQREIARRHMDAPGSGWLDVQMSTRDGRVVQTSWSNVRLSDGSRVGIGLDITERKAREAELVDARAVAERANRAKDEFLAMLGHELRNPLSAIGSAVAVLERLGHADPRGARASQIIARQTQHLARLMDDLLDAGRVMTGKIALERRAMDLLAAARRAVATLRAAGVTDRHAVSVDGRPAWVDGDATRLEQVVTNLVSNALKFTPAAGTIRVWVGVEGDAALLRVTDTGVGMAPDLLPRIFDLFVQGDQPPERATGGLGIGLTLVRQLVELHGGHIEAASAGPGQGSVFTVRLPRASGAGPDGAAARVDGAAPCRILLVEDNDDAREMLTALLTLERHDVITASDGPGGVEAALRLAPDVALVDIGLPGLSGYEVARRIRAAAPVRPIKLIALTGYGQSEDMRRAREAGFDLHLVKPVEPKRLDEALRALLRPDD